jgi:hypothetical protein
MQIRDDLNDLDPQPQTTASGRRDTAPIQRLALQNRAEEETVRLPMSLVALWNEQANPELETLQIRLNLPENLDEDETLTARLED